MLGMPMPSLALRVTLVLFISLATSLTLMTMVSTSPTACARWSLKNSRPPGRHSESAAACTGGTGGIGRLTGCQDGSLVGSPVGVSLGGPPISDSRVRKSLQPPSSSATAHSRAARLIARPPAPAPARSPASAGWRA